MGNRRCQFSLIKATKISVLLCKTQFSEPSADGLLLDATGNDVYAVLGDNDDVAVGAVELDDRGCELLGVLNENALIGYVVFTEECLALCGVAIVVKHNGLVLLNCEASGPHQGLLAWEWGLGGTTGGSISIVILGGSGRRISSGHFPRDGEKNM